MHFLICLDQLQCLGILMIVAFVDPRHICPHSRNNNAVIGARFDWWFAMCYSSQISLLKSSLWVKHGLSHADYLSAVFRQYDDLQAQVPQLDCDETTKELFLKVRYLPRIHDACAFPEG